MNENFIKKSNCNSNILNNAINEINKNKLNRPRYVLAKSETITIKDTITVDSNTSAKVIDNKVNDNHILTFMIPKGKDGLDGEMLAKRFPYLFLHKPYLKFISDLKGKGSSQEPERSKGGMAA